MSHCNISIFVPHAGCPHQCSFCNQKTISGQSYAPKADDVHRICRQAVTEVKDKENSEIAFFGGSLLQLTEIIWFLYLTLQNAIWVKTVLRE